MLAFSTAMWGQLPVVPGTDKPEHPQHTHRHDRRVNFGIKGGFTSSLFLVSDLVLNGTVIDEVQNNYKIGYFGSFFMRINFKRHFLQPELSYTINRCNITFEKPLPGALQPTAEAAEASRVASADAPRLGFSEDEQVARVGGFLRSIGLTRDFAPLVVPATTTVPPSRRRGEGAVCQGAKAVRYCRNSASLG